MTAQQKITAKIANITTERLIEMSTLIASGEAQDNITASSMILDAIELRMQEDDFIAHCELIEKLMDAA